MNVRRMVEYKLVTDNGVTFEEGDEITVNAKSIVYFGSLSDIGYEGITLFNEDWDEGEKFIPYSEIVDVERA